MAINTWLTWMTGECQEYTNDIIQGVKNNVAAQFEWQKMQEWHPQHEWVE